MWLRRNDGRVECRIVVDLLLPEMRGVVMVVEVEIQHRGALLLRTEGRKVVVDIWKSIWRGLRGRGMTGRFLGTIIFGRLFRREMIH